MAKNILVISCDIRETRAALIENGIIAELHIERKGRQSSTVGNVYLGKVTRVLPGLQAAFIDIGQERAAFLHVEDLIRPDDFDEYLAGGRRMARGKEEGGSVEDDEGEEPAPPAAAAEAVAEGELEPAASPASGADSVAKADDLEATIAYPDWPTPPARRIVAARRAPNGATDAAHALASADAETPPSSGESPTSGAGGSDASATLVSRATGEPTGLASVGAAGERPVVPVAEESEAVLIAGPLDSSIALD